MAALNRGGPQWCNIVLTLVERGGSARSFHIDGTTLGTLIPILRMDISREGVPSKPHRASL